MSKFMQIAVRLESTYGAGGFRKAFPNMTGLLRDIGYTLTLEQEPTLFHMVDVLVRIRNDPAPPENVKKPILQMLDRLTALRDQAREDLLGRRLNDLDQKLYRIEDLFMDLERELG